MLRDMISVLYKTNMGILTLRQALKMKKQTTLLYFSLLGPPNVIYQRPSIKKLHFTVAGTGGVDGCSSEDEELYNAVKNYVLEQ